jgi:hypothetical protein
MILKTLASKKPSHPSDARAFNVSEFNALKILAKNNTRNPTPGTDIQAFAGLYSLGFLA